jgi:hypothetical protein
MSIIDSSNWKDDARERNMIDSLRAGDKGHSITLTEIEAQRQGIKLTEAENNKLHTWMTEELDRNKLLDKSWMDVRASDTHRNDAADALQYSSELGRHKPSIDHPALPSIDEFGDRRGKPLDQYGLSEAYYARQSVNERMVKELMDYGIFRNDSADALQYFQKINETMKTSPDPITMTKEQAEAIINGGVAICRDGASPDHTSTWKEFLDEARANCEPIDQGIPFDSEPVQEGIEIAIHRANLLDDIQRDYHIIEEHKRRIKETRQKITQLDRVTLR